MLLLSIHPKFSFFRLRRKLEHNPLLKSQCQLDFEEDHEILSIVNARKGPRNHSAKPSYFKEEESRAQRREGIDPRSHSRSVLGL